jgi:hypothetical protein
MIAPNVVRAILGPLLITLILITICLKYALRGTVRAAYH